MILLRREQRERIYDKQTKLSFLFFCLSSSSSSQTYEKLHYNRKISSLFCSKTIWKSLFFPFFFFLPLYQVFFFFFNLLHSVTKTLFFLCNNIGSVQRIKKTTNQEFMGEEKAQIMYLGGRLTLTNERIFLRHTNHEWKKTHTFKPFYEMALSMMMKRKLS